MTDLWNHQKKGIALATAPGVDNFAYLFEQGTGKTRTMIETMRIIFSRNRRIMKTVIFCPKIVCDNWKDEIKKYSKIDPKDVLVCLGASVKRVAKLKKELGESLDHNKIIILNYESLMMDELYKLIEAWGPEVIICDEAQRIKNHSAKRTKKLLKMSEGVKHKYILTGTPILDGKGLDLFSQFKFMDNGKTFGQNFFSFRANFFYDKNSGMPQARHFPDWKMRPGASEAFAKAIGKSSLRVEKKDCLDLPPFVRQTVYVDLSPEQAKAYKSMYDDYIAWVKSKQGENVAVVANLAIVKSLRLQQIVSGYLMPEEGPSIPFEKNPRLEALEELLEDIVVDQGKKVIIWAVFRENYKMIATLLEKMKLKFSSITGDTSDKDRKQGIDDFYNDPSCMIMIANQAAGGVGINLIPASYAIYYSKNFNLEHDLQSEARNYRGGSQIHESVTRIDLVAKGTIDELVNEALSNKQKVSHEILTFTEQMRLRDE